MANIAIGTDTTLKTIRNGKAQQVYIASNCPEDIEKDLTSYCQLSNVPLTKLKYTNEELGEICRKPFLISVICKYQDG